MSGPAIDPTAVLQPREYQYELFQEARSRNVSCDLRACYGVLRPHRGLRLSSMLFRRLSHILEQVSFSIISNITR